LKIKVWIPPLLWALLILGASSISGESLPSSFIPHLDKVVHLGVYGVLGFLLARTPLSFFSIIILAAFFGMLDEFYQSLTPGRIPDFMDWVADLVGICLGVVFYRYVFLDWWRSRDENAH
jgi:VanZ family protein